MTKPANKRILVIAGSRRSGSPRGWAGIKFDDPDYSTDVNMGVGYALTLDYNTVKDGWYHVGRNEHPRHTCGDKDYRNCPAIGPRCAICQKSHWITS